MPAKPVISREEIAKLAGLAKLHLTEKQSATYSDQINSILQHMQTLQELDLTGVEPLSHVLELINTPQADEPGASLPREQVLANAPRPDHGEQAGEGATDGQYFLVPAVLAIHKGAGRTKS